MRWLYKASDSKGFADIKNLPTPIITLLNQRGIQNVEELEKFLHPSFEDLNDPFLLPNIKKAVKRIAQAMDNKEKIIVYGDYDADGVTATSILWDFLYRQLGLDVVPFIPSRFDEGYGLNAEALKTIQANGAKLVITVDCGVKDQKLIKEFKKIDFIVTDHHVLPQKHDFEHIVVHPSLANSKYPYKNISGAVVAWKLVHALAKTLNKERGLNLDFEKYVDLAAIGTVCDVMPLEQENRVIVKLGLEKMSETQNLGLSKLLEVTRLTDKKLTSFDLGYIIGPRINAAGRLGSALEAVRLFTTQNNNTAIRQAQLLDNLNVQRQEITMSVEKEVFASLETIDNSKKLIFVWGQGWSEGIVGLVAGRLLEKYKRPSICATLIDGKIIGSARSIKNFDITQLIAEHENLLVRFGGHSLAAGFTLEEQNLEAFKIALETKAAEVLSDDDIEPILNIDLKIGMEEVDKNLADYLENMEPFGYGNSTPIFEIDGLEIKKKFYMGKNNQHMKLYLEKDGKLLEAISFNSGSKLDNVNLNDKIDIVSHIKLNNWKGNTTIQLILQDFKVHTK